MVAVKDFFTNTCVLVTIIYISSLIHKNILTNINQKAKQILFIVMCIFTSWCSMFFGIHLTDSVIFDLRVVTIIISILFCTNPIHIFIISLGIGLVRFYFGLGQAAFSGFINMLILGVISVVLFYMLRKKNFIYKTVIAVLVINIFNVINIAIWGVIPSFEYLISIVPIALPASILFSTFLVWMLWDLHNEFIDKIDLQNKANKDPLTQLYNKRAFLYFYNKLISNSDKSYLPISAAFIDVDYFKNINDTYGHLAADSILQEISKRICYTVNDSDIVSRYGGDEFVILMPHSTKEMAIERMNELCKQLEDDGIEINNEKVHVTLSIGVSASPPVEPHKLLEAADNSLYKAKENGRNKVAYFNQN